MNATRICSVSGCDRKWESRQLCNMHYIRFMKHGDAGPAASKFTRSTTGICSFEGCDRKNHANLYCAEHNRQRSQGIELKPIKARLSPGASIKDRLDYLTAKSDRCWEWQGWKRAGYGILHVDGKKQSAHRIAYELEHGPIQDGLEIDHTCRNRGCVRVSHLQAVPHAINSQNLDVQQNNRVGYRGVYKHIGRKGEIRYGTRATANGKSYSGGHYDTPEEANEAVIRLRNRVQQNNRKDWDDEFTDD